MNFVKVLPLILKHCFDPFNRLPLKWSSEVDFLNIYLTTCFGVRKFEDTYAMRVTFFVKSLKFDLDLKNAQSNWEKGFCSWDNSISIGCIKLSLLRRENLSSVVGLLTDSLNTLNITINDFFQLSYLHNNQQI